MAYKLCFKCCCCFRCFSFRNCRSCTAKTIQLANELPKFREFHFNFLRGVVRATESLLACHLLLSTGSPLNAPYSFCDKDLPADRGLLYHTFHISSFYREGWISAAFSVLPSRDGWGREWHIIYVCDVNSKFNLCVVTKHRKWEIRVGNVTFFVLCLVVTLVFAIKINRNTY